MIDEFAMKELDNLLREVVKFIDKRVCHSTNCNSCKYSVPNSGGRCVLFVVYDVVRKWEESDD